MPFIYCSRCKTKSNDLVGSRGELRHMRVMDTTRSRSNDSKDYFCTPHCYLDYVFLSQVFRQAGLRYESGPVGRFMYDEGFEHAFASLVEHYDAIVQEAREGPGFRAFLRRNGYPEDSVVASSQSGKRARFFGSKRRRSKQQEQQEEQQWPQEQEQEESKEDLDSSWVSLQPAEPLSALASRSSLLSEATLAGSWADEN